MIETVAIKFPAPTHPLSVNESNRLHWATRRRRLQPWKKEAMYAWLEQVPFWTPGPVVISVSLPFERNGRRDPHNYTSTVVKSIIDGLIEGGMCPDDTSDWVTVLDPLLIVDKSLTARIVITRGDQ